MRSLYYKPLEPHMRKFRKNLNMKEMNEQLHNVNLKEELNRELNRENAILNPIAVDLKRQEIEEKYKEHLGQYKEKKLRRKAEDKAKIDLYKSQINKPKSRSQKVFEYRSDTDMPASRLAAFRRGAPYGYTKEMTPRPKPGMEEGQERKKGGKKAKHKTEKKNTLI